MKKILLFLIFISLSCCANESLDNKKEYFDYDAFDEIELIDSAPLKINIQKQQTNEIFNTDKKEGNSKFKFTQNSKQFKNEYMNDECKFTTGGEYTPFKFLNIASGLESSYRQYDQNSTKKFYFNPSVRLGEKVSIDFLNKVNIQNHTQSHDVGLKLSPFKSKNVDFGVYTGVNRTSEGVQTQNINFSTSIFF